MKINIMFNNNKLRRVSLFKWSSDEVGNYRDNKFFSNSNTSEYRGNIITILVITILLCFMIRIVTNIKFNVINRFNESSLHKDIGRIIIPSLIKIRSAVVESEENNGKRSISHVK